MTTPGEGELSGGVVEVGVDRGSGGWTRDKAGDGARPRGLEGRGGRERRKGGREGVDY